jgi:mannose/fructose/N-acetylgalactosamine-specific phosphotransferase system component IIC
MENLFNIFWIAILGGFINLDYTVFAQIMISRPIVTAPLCGYILGMLLNSPLEGLNIGLVMGAFLELLWLNTLPVGASVPPNVCIASTFGISLFLLIREEITVDINLLMMVVIIEAFIVGLLGGRLDKLYRDIFNKKIARKIINYVDEGKIWGLEVFNDFSVFIHFLYGFLLCFLLIVALIYPTIALINFLPDKIIKGLLIAKSLLPLFGIAVAINMFFTKRSFSYLIIGFILAFICRFPY